MASCFGAGIDPSARLQGRCDNTNAAAEALGSHETAVPDCMESTLSRGRAALYRQELQHGKSSRSLRRWYWSGPSTINALIDLSPSAREGAGKTRLKGPHLPAQRRAWVLPQGA